MQHTIKFVDSIAQFSFLFPFDIDPNEFTALYEAAIAAS
jgi:hypothetical protein